MKEFIKLIVILFIAVGIGWNFNRGYGQASLSDLTLNNIEALANTTESSNECEGCLNSLYICRYYGDWGGCFGSAYIFDA